MVIELFSDIILPVILTFITAPMIAPLDIRNVFRHFQNQRKPINHDIQKAIKIAYLNALIEIATEWKRGKITSFRLYLPNQIDSKIQEWQNEVKQVEKAKDESQIAPPFQNIEEIEQLLLSHGESAPNFQELETKLINEALQGIVDIPDDYQNQIETKLFTRIHAHFIEQLKVNDRAFRAFQLEYLPAISDCLKQMGIGQEQIALMIDNISSVINRTDENVQKILDIVQPKSSTIEDWKDICRQNLAAAKELTSNQFAETNKPTPQLDDIYVPLAILKGNYSQTNQREEKEQNQLIPIAEDSFLEDVLRQGKSDISKGRRIEIIGEPGSGKTTRLQKIADWILEQDLGLPVFIKLAYLENQNICQYLENEWLPKCKGEVKRRDLESEISQVWLLLDGVDEMSRSQKMEQLAEDLSTSWMQPARVVVTCRVNVWEADKNAFSGFDIFRNLEFNKEQNQMIPIAEDSFFEDVLRQGRSDISQGRRIAIIGEPGSGKSTRLQKIADWILEQDLGLPVFISLRDLTLPTVHQYIKEIWLSQTGKNVTIDELTQHKERIWLLLDGLDEITSSVETRHVNALLGGWVESARVVVTCRVNVWEADKNAFSGFDIFRNLEFNSEQVNHYICRWFEGIGDEAAGESLEAQLRQSENFRLKELIQNPLRLWMLCQIWQSNMGTLPQTQAELYEKFVDWVYKWKADENILEERETIDKALGKLALAAIEQKNEVSRFRLPESWVLKVLGSRRIFKAVEKLGLLNRVERFPEAIYVFYHATFEEYFAALAVEDWDYFLPSNHVDMPVEGKEYRIFETQWKQVILLWLGRGDIGDEKKEEFISKLVNFDDGCGKWNFKKADRGFYEYQAFFLAAAGINEFKNCSLASDIVAHVVKWGFGYLNIDKPEWRFFLNPIEEEAKKAIQETIRQLAITEITQIIENCQDEDIIREAIKYLEEIASGNAQAIACLIRVIESTEDKYTRRWAAESLGKIASGNAQAIDCLIRLIESTDNEYTRRQAAESLGEIDSGNPHVIAGLISVIESTESEYTRRQAAESLGKIASGNKEAIAGLIRVIKSTKSEDTLRQAAESLGKIDSGNPEAIASLIRVIESTDNESTRWRAAESLGQIDSGNQEAIAALIRIIESTDNESTRLEAAESLGKIAPGNQEAIAALIIIIESTDNESTRLEAASSLGKIASGNPQAIAASIRVIQSTEDEYTRRKAAHSLEKIALEKILTTPKQCSDVVSALKHKLSDEVYQNDVGRFYECYKLIWNCAANLPYPQFYQAWQD